MSTLFQRAAAGQRAAMQQLYEQHKQTAFYIAYRLLSDDIHVNTTVVRAFTAVFGALAAKPVDSKTAFSQLVVSHVVDYCKKQLVRRNPKALRIPQDRRFLLPADVTPVMSDDLSETVLSYFSDFQRIIFVLHTVGNMDADTLAAVAKLDTRTLQTALTAERQNIERILHTIGKSDMTYTEFARQFTIGETSVAVPTAIDEQVEKSIDAIAAPIEKKQRITLLKISLITIAVCAAIIGLCAATLLSFPTSDTTAITDDDGTAAATDADTDVDLSNVGTVTSVKATHYAEIAIENYGTIKVALDAQTAPETVQNFIDLSEQGFYDGLTFHRIMEGFVMQGGDPNGNGSGGSDKTIPGEFAYNGFDNPLSHVRGAISMARSDDYDSASSQFFIVHDDSTDLDGQYAVFGYIVEGMDIVDAICAAAEPTDDIGSIAAEDQPVISYVIVYEASADDAEKTIDTIHTTDAE